MKTFLDKYYKIVGFIIGFSLLFLDLLICNNQVYYYDAWLYDQIATIFQNQGLFHFVFHFEPGTFESTAFNMRGYAWPLIIAICNTLGNTTWTGYWFWLSAFYALGMAYALPELIEEVFHKKITWYLRFIPTLLTIIFWNGLIIHPLSDIPAVIAVALGLCLLSKISDEKNILLNILYAVFCGLILGVSYYVRSGCKPIIVLAIITIIIYKFKKQNLKKIIIIGVLCVGCGISVIPQVLINSSCLNIVSYQVPIFLTTDVGSGSYGNQFKMLRYETNVSSKHPDEALVSRDSLIDTILATEDLVETDVDLKTFFVLFAKYPLEFLGLYTTKFANFIDPRWGNQIYLTDLHARQYLVMISNFILWFFAFWGIGIEINKGVVEKESSQLKNVLLFFKNYFIYIFSFFVPALVHLAATHVEARYFYPGHILMYTYLAMLCPWKKIWEVLKTKWFTTLVIAFVLFGCLNSIWNFTFENFHYSRLFYEDGFVIEEVTVDEFVNKHSDDLGIQYGIDYFNMSTPTQIEMDGYIYSTKRECKSNELTLVLSSGNVQYCFDIHLKENDKLKKEYKHSKFNINKDLNALKDGQYRIGLLIKNGSESQIVFSDYTVDIQK